jgi:hypothetical protein
VCPIRYRVACCNRTQAGKIVQHTYCAAPILTLRVSVRFDSQAYNMGTMVQGNKIQVVGRVPILQSPHCLMLLQSCTQARHSFTASTQATALGNNLCALNCKTSENLSKGGRNILRLEATQAPRIPYVLIHLSTLRQFCIHAIPSALLRRMVSFRVIPKSHLIPQVDEVTGDLRVERRVQMSWT